MGQANSLATYLLPLTGGLSHVGRRAPPLSKFVGHPSPFGWNVSFMEVRSQDGMSGCRPEAAAQGDRFRPRTETQVCPKRSSQPLSERPAVESPIPSRGLGVIAICGESSQRWPPNSPRSCVSGQFAILIRAADGRPIGRQLCGVITQLAGNHESSGCVHGPGPSLKVVDVRGTGCRVLRYIPAEKASDG